jgi:pimeloyl-ACP methyl ester carboxylesterase
MLATTQPPPAKIVLITPFDSMVRVASEKFFFLPVWLLLLDRWDNIESLQGFQGDIDIYAAEADEVIPIVHAKALSETSPNIRFHVLPGGHNDWSSCDRVTISQ